MMPTLTTGTEAQRRGQERGGQERGGQERGGQERGGQERRGQERGGQERRGHGVQDRRGHGVQDWGQERGGQERRGQERGGHGVQDWGQERGGQDRRGHGVQDCPDGSRYEGEFLNGLKHGTGKSTWRNGEYYEGSFYRDQRHGSGEYCWPGGSKFSGRFYLNRKEGYGTLLFPDGTMFQGLYHADERFGPGVVSYPDGRQDVGFWHRERLLVLCDSVEGGFSLRDDTEYAAYIRPDATTDPLTQPAVDLLRWPDTELPEEQDNLPPDLERYLPLPPRLRRHLDRLFHGLLRDPEPQDEHRLDPETLDDLPLQPRLAALTHTHRQGADALGWDVSAVLSLSRGGFGPKGPLELSSEQLIMAATLGDQQAVYRALCHGLVHPDVGDASGHTALIAATVNCHNDVIHLLLDNGADVDQLTCEGMSALAVCCVLYYPIQALQTTLAEREHPKPPTKTQALKSHSPWVSRPQTSPTELATDTTIPNNRPQTSPVELATDTVNANSPRIISLDEQTGPAVGATEQQVPGHGSDASDDGDLSHNLLTRPQTGTDTRYTEEKEEDDKNDQEESEREREEREGEEEQDDEEGEVGERREREEEQDDEEGEVGERREREEEQDDEEGEVGERREREEEQDDEEGEVGERREREEEQDDEREERGEGEVPGEEHSMQVLDGHIPLGIVSWREGGAKAGSTVQATVGQCSSDLPFDSTHSLDSYHIRVTEEVMQRSAEALSHTGIPQSTDTQETVRKMAAMKTEHRGLWGTLKLLLHRGADPNKPRVPMPVLFLAIKAAHTEAVRLLLQHGARTNIHLPAERLGLYPLHIAVGLSGPEGPRITEMLLHAASDPDTQALDQHQAYHLDKVSLEPQGSLGNKTLAPPTSSKTLAPPTSSDPHLGGGRTALHVACQREDDYTNSREVVSLLLSHRASTQLLWSGHSPLSLAIASGNHLTVEELLRAGADPNLPLSSRVGSALCVLTNINYDSGARPRNKTKLLDLLMKTGANILMPVMVGEGQRCALGTAVDYGHYSFSQDWRIGHSPYHTLTVREREMYNSRRQLLGMMGDLLRQAAVHMESKRTSGFHNTMPPEGGGLRVVLPDDQQGGLEAENQLNKRRGIKGLILRKSCFKYCYQCGRSVAVMLTACSRCHEVLYCSKTCRIRAWKERHKDECLPATARSVWLKSRGAAEPLSMTQEVSESHFNPQENYSFN